MAALHGCCFCYESLLLCSDWLVSVPPSTRVMRYMPRRNAARDIPSNTKIDTPIRKIMRYGIQWSGHTRRLEHTHHDASAYPVNTTTPAMKPMMAPIVRTFGICLILVGILI